MPTARRLGLRRTSAGGSVVTPPQPYLSVPYLIYDMIMIYATAHTEGREQHSTVPPLSIDLHPYLNSFPFGLKNG